MLNRAIERVARRLKLDPIADRNEIILYHTHEVHQEIDKQFVAGMLLMLIGIVGGIIVVMALCVVRNHTPM